jgi:hypothetical protein
MESKLDSGALKKILLKINMGEDTLLVLRIMTNSLWLVNQMMAFLSAA